ncbi:RES domain-containing protein [Paenibacillus filicis]|uniref:RES domain-containing protein n=2 Tax=Paenibacillus filicis TaxID=669464 RepID=A0ABU9DPW4_9BACL
MDSFYHGTRLCDAFTESEFYYLVQQMTCPHCGGPVTEFFSPYELKFDVPTRFETDVEEIATLAEQTPFLLLSHPFAQTVFDEIHRLSKHTPVISLPAPMFRARKCDSKHSFSSIDFMAPKRGIIAEGRYNHAGNQVYYLAEDLVTCFYEMRMPNEGIMLGRIEVSEPLKVLDLMDEQLEENSIIQAIQWSSLLSSPAEGEGWHKSHYVFTRFVADVARSAGFDAIRYPSVRFHEGYNYVLLDYEKVKPWIFVLDFQQVSKEEILAERDKNRRFSRTSSSH